MQQNTKRFLVTCLVLWGVLMSINTYAQQVYYSQPEKDDSRNTAFDIIGKVGNHILVYKNNNDDDAISIYDDQMNPVNRVPLRFRYDLLDVDFIDYPDKFLMLFQYQHRQFVYFYGMVMDQNANTLAGPYLIDSTEVGMSAVKTRLYSIAYSEDKKKILVYKINQSKDLTNTFYTFLLDDDLNLLRSGKEALRMESRRDYLSGFTLSNNGDFIFDKVEKSSSRDFIDMASLVMKPAMQDTFYVTDIKLKGMYLDEFKVKLDNQNSEAYFASFYYARRRSDVTGIYYIKLNFASDTISDIKFLPFDNNLKAAARNGTARDDAFDDYFLRQIVIKSDGGFIVTAESFYANSQASPWNRWDYLYGPYSLSPYYYYSPFSPWYYSPFNQGINSNRFHYKDIAVLCYDGNGNLQWSNFIRKDQFDNETDDFLSYQAVNIGSALDFLYNEPYRSSYILADQELTPDGQLTREPTFRNLDRGYEFMPRYGKQVSADETVIPCVYRNFICFAKIQF
jgi:hypothetical protein